MLGNLRLRPCLPQAEKRRCTLQDSANGILPSATSELAEDVQGASVQQQVLATTLHQLEADWNRHAFPLTLASSATHDGHEDQRQHKHGGGAHLTEPQHRWHFETEDSVTAIQANLESGSVVAVKLQDSSAACLG